MHERNCHAALADGSRDALHRSESHVTTGKDAGNTGLQEVWVTIEPPAIRGAHVGAREYEAARVERDLGREPCGLRIRTDEDEEKSPPDTPDGKPR